MLALVALCLLQEAPATDGALPTAVVLASRRAATEALAPKVVTQVRAVLAKEGLVMTSEAETAKRLGKVDPRKCQGAQACLAKAAETARAVLVGVDVAKARKNLLIHLAAVSPSGELLHETDLEVPAVKWEPALAVPVTGFARVVAERLAPARPPPTPPVEPPPPPPLVETKPVDKPVATKLTPTRTDVPTVTAPPPSRGGKGKWIALGGTVAAGGAAAAFAAVGLSAKAAVDASRYDAGGVTGSRLTDAELRAKAGTANTFATLSVGAAAATAVLAGVTTWLFVTSGAPAEAPEEMP